MNRTLSGQDIEALFDHLLELDETFRAHEIARIEKSDPPLAARLRRLFSYTQGYGSCPADLAATAPTLLAAFANENEQERIGYQLGAYEITAFIKRGGMGAVYRAERTDGAFKQTVAVKFLPAQWATKSRRNLFERERQYLATLEHPNIARIIDAGIAPDGSPYFILEYVEGENFATAMGASSVKKGVRYFLELLGAVSFCHRSLIVHGDLKPSNILISDDRVRLLDFGVGYFADPDIAIKDKRVHGYSMEYAAPELRAGKVASVQTDIYALGVLLKKCMPAIAENHELLAIADKASADDPSARYETVDALRSDLDAYREHRPVTALAATRSYRFKKFLFRNRVAMTSLTAVFFTLSLGLAMTMWQYQYAKHQTARAETVASFLTSMFDRIDPESAGVEPVTLRDLMKEADQRLDTDLAGAPAIQNEVKAVIASGYLGLGEFERALELREEVLSYFQEKYEPPNEHIARAQTSLALVLHAYGRNDEALLLCRDTVEQSKLLNLEQSVLMAEALDCVSHNLLQLRSGAATAEAVLLKQRMLEIYERIYPSGHPKIGYAISALGEALHLAGNHEAAAQHREEALAIAEKNGLTSLPSFISARCNLAIDYAALGRYQETLEMNQLCLKSKIERLGEDHPEIAAPYNNLARFYLLLGDVENGLAATNAGRKIAEQYFPDTNLVRIALEINRAAALWQLGAGEDAHVVISNVIRSMSESFGKEHSATYRARTIEARILLELGKVEDAERVMATSIAELRPSWEADALLWRAEIALAKENYRQASELAAQSLMKRRSISVFRPWQVAEAEFIEALASSDKTRATKTARMLTKLPPAHIRRKQAEQYLGSIN